MTPKAADAIATQPVTITVICTNFPGRLFDGCDDLQVGWGQARTVIDAVPGDSIEARFTTELQARQHSDGTVDFRGPLVQGKVGERFLYLVWHHADAPQTPLRRIKIPLYTLINWGDLQSGQIMAHLQMSDHDGCPICATPKPPYLQWQVESKSKR